MLDDLKLLLRCHNGIFISVILGVLLGGGLVLVLSCTLFGFRIRLGRWSLLLLLFLGLGLGLTTGWGLVIDITLLR